MERKVIPTEKEVRTLRALCAAGVITEEEMRNVLRRRMGLPPAQVDDPATHK